ncbi:MAG TPA: DMT family transporter [Patescibacteria group bacterium]|nr:DMT family transporter [Patescibacteria group bacterium]
MTNSSPTPGWLAPSLLTGFGLLLGTVPLLAKLSAQTGLSEPAFALWQALGAGLAVLAVCVAKRTPPPLSIRHLRYYLLSGLTGIALPNLLLYWVVPRLGAGLASVSYAFPPLFTLALALLWRMERPRLHRVGGILLGLAGALMIALPQGGSLPAAVSPWWLLPALAAPLVLAIGNIYRSHDWPPDTAPLPLAAGMLLGGAVELIPLLGTASGGILPIDEASALLLLAAIAVTAGGYLMFLELQRVAGPVYLSQVGTVMTPTGLALGTLFLGEHYGAWVWVAVAVIFVGVALTNWRR